MLSVLRGTRIGVVLQQRRLEPPVVLLYLVVWLLLVAGGIAGWFRLWPALGQPFGGFIWQYGDAAGFLVSYDTPKHWAGPRAGLVPFTTVTAINYQPARDFGTLYASLPPGTPVTYQTIAQNGQQRQITLPTEVFSINQLGEAYGLIFLVALVASGAGYTLVRSARSTGQRLVAFVLLAAAAPAFFHTHNGSITSFAGYERIRLFAALMWAPCPALLGALLCHMALVYPHPGSLARRFPRLVTVLYGSGLVLAAWLALAYLWGANAHVAALQLVLLYISIGYLLLGVVATVVRGARVALWPARGLSLAEVRQVRTLAVAWLVTMAMLLGTIAASVLNIALPFEALIAIALFLPLGLVYAVRNADLVADLERENAIKHRLLEDLREIHQLQERMLGEIADELHDSILAESKGLEVRLYTLTQQYSRGIVSADDLSAELTHLHRQSQALLLMLRQTVEGAKPVDFQQEGLVAALERFMAHLNAVSSSTHYRMQASDTIEHCSPEVKREAYWIIRAALNNVRDHAQAQQSLVMLSRTASALQLSIHDDGCGMGGLPTPERGGLPRRKLGLPAIQSRAARLGGSVTITALQPGTLVQVTLPCSAGA